MQELTTDFLSAEPQDKAARKQHLGNWGTYAAAAGAALAMSTSASAEIMYSGIQDITVSVAASGGTNHAAFTVAAVHELLLVSNVMNVTVKSNKLSHVAGAVVSGPGVSPNLQFFRTKTVNFATVAIDYARAQMISGGAKRSSGAVLRQHFAPGGAELDGAFGPGTVTGFVGFKVSGGSLNGDFGWMQVKVSDSASPGYPNEAEVIDWAYDNSGAAIAAGDTGQVVTPEPGTAALGLLAFGAMGILALRKRRKELAAE